MPPLIALSLAVTAIGSILIADSRRRPGVSIAVWLPTLLLLILGSRPVSLWVSGGVPLAGAGVNGGDGSPFDRYSYLALIVASFLVGSLRGMKWGRMLAANPILVVFYVYFALSICWSSDPGGSFKRLVKDGGAVFVMAVLYSERNPLEAIRAAYVRCAAVLFPLSVVFIKYFPDLGRAYTTSGESMFTGVTTQKNSLGEIVLVFGLVLIWECVESLKGSGANRKRRLPWECLLLLGTALWLLNISESKTALICLSIGAVLLVSGRWVGHRLTGTLILTAALSGPVLLVFVENIGDVIAPLVAAVGRDMTFTGRTEIWQHIDLNTVHPLFGAGFWNFWGSDRGEMLRVTMNTPGLDSAHNGFLDVYLDGGFLGLSLLVTGLLVQGARICGSHQRERFAQVRFAVLIAAILYNLSESTFARLTPIWVTVLMVMVDYRPAQHTLRRAMKDAHRRLARPASAQTSRPTGLAPYERRVS